MALTVAFSTSQVLGEPSKIYLVDDSTGTDAAVTTRRIYLQKADGTYLVQEGTVTDYEVWALPLATGKTLDLLDKDYVLSIRVDWLNVSGTVLYTKTVLTLFSLYLKTFFYYLTQQQSASPNLIADTSYFNNKAKLWTYITSAINAVSVGGDQFGAQTALDAGTYMISNELANY